MTTYIKEWHNRYGDIESEYEPDELIEFALEILDNRTLNESDKLFYKFIISREHLIKDELDKMYDLFFEMDSKVMLFKLYDESLYKIYMEMWVEMNTNFKKFKDKISKLPCKGECMICYESIKIGIQCKNKHNQFICSGCCFNMLLNGDKKCPLCREHLKIRPIEISNELFMPKNKPMFASDFFESFDGLFPLEQVGYYWMLSMHIELQQVMKDVLELE